MKSAAAAVVLAATLVPSAFGQEVTVLSIGYICSAERVAQPHTGARRLQIETGMGSEGFPVRTANPEAQRWFDYGVTLWHAFYHDDAKRAFDKAAQTDPDCAMCVWGQALSRGPTQNFDIEPPQVKEAQGLADKALAAARTPLEKALAQALVARYAAKQDPAAEIAFADALLKANALQPDAQDLTLIAGEALLTAWRRGDHKAADRAMGLIEPILKRRPDNAAAIHYWIHATEMAGKPELALPYAGRLAELAPKASHLVHMASHTYLRLGYYEDAAAINAKALDVDAVHAEDTNLPGGLGAPDYYGHNLSMGLAGALMSGDGPLALKFADDAPVALPKNTYVAARAVVAYGRYAPDKALALPPPSGGDDYPKVMWRYGRGEAYAAKGDAGGLHGEAAALAALLQAKPKLNDFELAQARLAQKVLDGRIAMLEGRPADAARIFRDAASAQEKADWGTDPPPWWYPVRRSLAAAELELGKAKDAAKDARKSLDAWPQDGLALQVLASAQAALGQAADAQRSQAESRKWWRGGTLALDLI
jgi:tetratricopeptide (TPR) repeat protein